MKYRLYGIAFDFKDNREWVGKKDTKISHNHFNTNNY